MINVKLLVDIKSVQNVEESVEKSESDPYELAKLKALFDVGLQLFKEDTRINLEDYLSDANSSEEVLEKWSVLKTHDFFKDFPDPPVEKILTDGYDFKTLSEEFTSIVIYKILSSWMYTLFLRYSETGETILDKNYQITGKLALKYHQEMQIMVEKLMPPLNSYRDIIRAVCDHVLDEQMYVELPFSMYLVRDLICPRITSTLDSTPLLSLK